MDNYVFNQSGNGNVQIANAESVTIKNGIITMERLTKLYKGGRYGLVKVKDNEQEVDSPYPNTLRAILECFQQLGAYEDTGMTPAEIVAMREELERAKGDLLMVCTMGEPCAACHHCCNRGDQFPCDIEREWCGGARWVWRGSPELKAADGQPQPGAPFDEPIPAPANRVLSLVEVLALPEGARVWVEEREEYVESGVHTRSGHYLIDDDGGDYDLFYKDWHLDGSCERIDCRVWSLPVAPTEDELAKYPWEVRDDG